jgi:hypothetical protein
MQRNFAKQSCALCDVFVPDDPPHVLFECPGLREDRAKLWPSVTRVMPPAMVESVQELNNQIKTQFLLSGLRANYTHEWKSVYENVARYIHDMYNARNKMYEDLLKYTLPRQRIMRQMTMEEWLI